MACSGNGTNCNLGVDLVGTGPIEYGHGYEISWSLYRSCQAFSFLFFIGGFFGNLLVIIVLLSSSVSQISTTDTLLLNLAFGDLIASVALPLKYFIELTSGLAHLGNGGCRFFALLEETTVSLSVTTLLAAVWHFGRNVFRPSVGDLSRRSLSFVVVGIWLIAAIPALPYAGSVHSIGRHCSVLWSPHIDLIYGIFLFAVQSLLPIFIFTVVFVQVGVTISQAGIIPRPAPDTQADEGISLMEEQRAANKRKCKLLLTITVAFYAIVLPYSFSQFWFYLDLGNIWGKSYALNLLLAFELVLCGKCIVNPIIYAVLFETFKDGFKRMIKANRKRYNFVHVRYNFRREPQQRHRMNGMEDGTNVYMSTTIDGMNEVDLCDNEDMYDDYEIGETDRDDVAILR